MTQKERNRRGDAEESQEEINPAMVTLPEEVEPL
jgi:hypothetical protein